jgi:hypothetical protein
MPQNKQGKKTRPQEKVLKPKFLKPKTEIPKQVRDDKKESQTLLSCCTRFSI